MPLPSAPASIPVDSTLIAAIKTGLPTSLTDPARPFRVMLRARFAQVEQILVTVRAVVAAVDTLVTAAAQTATDIGNLQRADAAASARSAVIEQALTRTATLATVQGNTARIAELELLLSNGVPTGGTTVPTTPVASTQPRLRLSAQGQIVR